MTPELQTLTAIFLAAAVTYALRAGGLLTAARLPKNPRFRQGMRALPGVLILSIAVPAVTEHGLPGLTAGILTALVALRTGNTLAAMVAGMLLMVVVRHAGG